MLVALEAANVSNQASPTTVDVKGRFIDCLP